MLPFAYGAFEQAGLFENQETAGPSDAFVPGEGAAVFMLEERTRAVERGAVILGEIAGYASAAATVDHAGGEAWGALGLTLTHVLDAASWTPADVQSLTLTTVVKPGDRILAGPAIAAVFGPAGERILRPNHAGCLGHALAAAGPIEMGLLLTEEQGGSRMLCSALGCSGQAVTLAFRSGRDGGGVL